VSNFADHLILPLTRHLLLIKSPASGSDIFVRTCHGRLTLADGRRASRGCAAAPGALFPRPINRFSSDIVINGHLSHSHFRLLRGIEHPKKLLSSNVLRRCCSVNGRSVAGIHVALDSIDMSHLPKLQGDSVDDHCAVWVSDGEQVSVVIAWEMSSSVK